MASPLPCTAWPASTPRRLCARSSRSTLWRTSPLARRAICCPRSPTRLAPSISLRSACRPWRSMRPGCWPARPPAPVRRSAAPTPRRRCGRPPRPAWGWPVQGAIGRGSGDGGVGMVISGSSSMAGAVPVGGGGGCQHVAVRNPRNKRCPDGQFDARDKRHGSLARFPPGIIAGMSQVLMGRGRGGARRAGALWRARWIAGSLVLALLAGCSARARLAPAAARRLGR